MGGIARTLADGLEEAGGRIAYKANVKRILVEDGKAVRRTVEPSSYLRRMTHWKFAVAKLSVLQDL